jgi:hypothetical protein
MFNAQTGQYLILRNEENEIVDKLVWTGTGYRPLKYSNFNSQWFGEVKPIKNDIY